MVDAGFISTVHHGAHTSYWFYTRANNVNKGSIKITERFYETDDNRFDYELHLGAFINHASAAQNVVNSWMWSGYTKLGRLIKRLFIKDIYIAMDEPASEANAYSDVQCAVSDVDYGDQIMPDLSYEGTFGYGWIRNFYAVNAADGATQNLQQVWNGAGLLNMSGYLYGSAHNRSVAYEWQSPKHYHYDHLQVTKPIGFWHRSNGYVAAHSAYAIIKIVAMVKLFP